MKYKMDPLSRCKDAAAGHGYAMIDLAVAKYWDYILPYKGIETDPLLDAAAQEGYYAETVADFYRFEHQHATAAKYDRRAYRLRVFETEDSENKNAKYSLSRTHAFGKGTKQDHKRAYFWNLQAAHENDASAVHTMSKFWQDGGAVPISRDMAEAWQQNDGKENPMQLSGDAAELFDMASTAASCEEKLEVLQLQEKEPVAHYEIRDLSANDKAQRKNKRSNKNQGILGKLSILYAVASIVCFLITALAGYRDTGILHLFNQGFYYLLGVPAKAFIAFTSELKFAEITIEYVCNFFKVSGLFGIFSLAAEAILFGIWLLIVCVGLLILITGLMDMGKSEGIEIKKLSQDSKETEQVALQAENYRAQLAEARAKIQDICSRAGIAVHDDVTLVALCDIASAKGVSLSSAEALYNSYCVANEAPVFSPICNEKGRKYNLYPLYFLLRRMGYPYAPLPQEDLPDGSGLVSAWRHYRLGKDYKKSEQKLLNITQSSVATPLEKAYAHWHLAAFYAKEGMVVTEVYSNEEKKLLEDAKKNVLLHSNRAKELGCPLSDMGTALWNLNLEALEMLRTAAQGQEVLCEYLEYLIDLVRNTAKDCGDPVRKGEWNGYETGKLWVEYEECLALYQKAATGKPTLSEAGSERAWYSYDSIEYSPIKNRLEKSAGKGLVRLDMLYRSISERIDLANFVLNREDEERRKQNELRQMQIDRKMSEYKEHLDWIERGANGFFNDSYKTEFERMLTGEISQHDFMTSEMLRDQAIRSHRQKLEDEVGS